jgi:hypothetical protein
VCKHSVRWTDHSENSVPKRFQYVTNFESILLRLIVAN